MRAVRLSLAAVVVATVLAHVRCLGLGFVYDDHRFVEKNPSIATLAEPWRFFADPTTASAAQGVEPDVWQPLRTLHFAVDRALFRLDPAGFHLGNLVIHVLVAALVWRLLLVLLRGEVARGPWPAGAAAERAAAVAAAAGALFFALHPVTVEAVAWVSSRGDLLAWAERQRSE